MAVEAPEVIHLPSAEEQTEFETSYRESHDREGSIGKSGITWSPQAGSQTEFMQCPLYEVLYHGTRGPGKRVSLCTPVLTDRGWIRAGEVTMSDRLVALDGSYASVEGIFPCRDRELFKVEFHDGATVLADAEHRWLVLNGKTGYREGGWKVRTTDQIRRASVPYSVPFLQGPIPGEEWDGVDPYMVGLMLGDGTMRSARVTLYSADDEILEFASSLGWNRYKYDGQCGRAVCPEGMSAPWRDLLPGDLSGDKSVPDDLMGSDPDTRLAVLQGLMDSDGTIEKNGGGQRFVSKSERLARDVSRLVWSLGGAANVYREDRKSMLGGVDWRWRVNLRHNNKFCPFRLSRKASRVCEQKKFLTRGIKSIEPAGTGDGVCFAVDHESHCFVVGDWVVTHNTDALIMDFAQHVGQGHGAAWSGILFRKTYPQLGDVVAKTHRWFPRIFPEAKFNWGRMSWIWPTGEVLRFRHMARPEDYWNYHGHEYPWIGWEELTSWSDDLCYTSMFSCCRSSTPNVPRKIRATTNPYGVGTNWVKDRWNLAGQWWLTVMQLEPTDVKGRKQRPRCAIHGHIDENQILLEADPDYKDSIASAAANEAMAKAWLYGSWDIVAGGMFDDVWTRHNLIPQFQIPSTWPIDRAFDWGSSKPFSVGWYAQSDGSDVAMDDGRHVATVRGDVFRIREWYGWTGKANQGKKFLAVDVAEGIVEREIMYDWRSRGIDRVVPGPADTSIFTVENGTSIAMDMAKPVRIDGRIHEGVHWTRADKSPGSRKMGWEMMRKMIRNARPRKEGLPREAPGLFVFQDHNPQFLRTVLSLPRDEKNLDDVDTDAEDHIGDEVRYRVRRSGAGADQGKTVGMY